MVALIVSACAVVPASAASWTQTAYVWQRESSPAVAEAIARGDELLAGLHLLAAEVAWQNGTWEEWRPIRDYAELVARGKPVGLVLRVGPFSGPFARDDATARRLATLARDIVAEARAAGLHPAELQIDFDCAESKLTGYAEWLQAFRAVVAPTPLTITALPSWMNAPAAFAALVRETGGYVLQVHSLERPVGPDAPFTLCDPARALAWIDRAAKFDIPFRVALPTYGYALTFDAAGRFVSLGAEPSPGAAPPGGRQRIILADAVAMAELARAIPTRRPAHCEGVIWFRLPVEGDQLNWAWPTFALVARGETPSRRLAPVATWSEPRLAEIAWVNTGDTTELIEAPLQLAWPPSARLVAADALGVHHVRVATGRPEAAIGLAPGAPAILLTPGERRAVAWFRFADVGAPAIELTVRVAPAP